MDSLTTLAICVAIGLFFEPGWRLHPGARAKIAEERAHHHHHHESEGPTEQDEPQVHSENSQHSQPSEHRAPSPSVKQGSGPTNIFLVPGRMVFENINLQAKTAVSRGTSGLAALAASCGVWLRSPVGVELAIPYTLLSGAILLWRRYDESVKARLSPAVRPVSPLAPKLDLNDARGEEEFFDDWPVAYVVFVVGLGLGLGFARSIYRATVVNSAPAAPPVVITKVQSGAVEAKRTTPVPVRGVEGAKAMLGKAGAKTKATGNRRGAELQRHGASDAGAAEDLEKGDERNVSKGESIPEEYSVWTPQTSWAGGANSSPTANDGWAPQNSWGEPLVVGEASGRASADAATAG